MAERVAREDILRISDAPYRDRAEQLSVARGEYQLVLLLEIRDLLEKLVPKDPTDAG